MVLSEGLVLKLCYLSELIKTRYVYMYMDLFVLHENYCTQFQDNLKVLLWFPDV